MKESWKAEPKKPRRIVAGHVMTAKSFRWLGERLFDRVHAAQGWKDNSWPSELRPHVIEWYQQNRLQFVDWEAWKDFENQRSSTGHWIFCEQDFLEQWPNALKAARLALANAEAVRVATAFGSLDEWLAADMRNQITASVRGGEGALPLDVERATFLSAMKRRRRWPQNCTTCGESFRPAKGGLKRCDVCRSAPSVKKGSTQRVLASPHTPQKLLPATATPTPQSTMIRTISVNHPQSNVPALTVEQLYSTMDEVLKKMQDAFKNAGPL